MKLFRIATNRSFAVVVAALLISAAIIPIPHARAQKEQPSSPAGATPAPANTSPGPSPADDQYFRGIYSRFFETYTLGPADVIAIRVTGQPDYSFDRVVVSPVGRVYHPLLGDVYVAGMNIDQVNAKLTTSLSQYIIDPKVSVSLVEANSAKIGVIGEVKKPGIVIMSRPMTVVDAIAEAGGATTFGKSKIELVRTVGEGRLVRRQIDLKRILQAKASPEDNVTMQAGDVVIVGENLRGKVTLFAALAGFGGFLAYVAK